MSFNIHDLNRNACMLKGPLRSEGYDWWWHSFTGVNVRTGEERSFFVEFFLCNPEFSGRAPTFGQLPFCRDNGVKPSYLMVKAGAWGEGAKQIHRFFGWNKASVSQVAPYSVLADDCFASDFVLKGSVDLSEEECAEHPEYMCSAGKMRWDLRLDKQIAFNVGYGAAKPFRAAQAFEMYWHAEGMKTAYAGEVEFDGEKYEVTPERCYGYADKKWGRGFTSPWVWLSSSDLFSNLTGKALKNSVFDIGGGQPKVAGISLGRQLLSAFYYEGREFEFNFSKPALFTQTRFDCGETETEIRWHVSQTSAYGKMETRISCPKSEMLFMNYEAPDGSMPLKRLWNGGTGKGRIKLYGRDDDGKLFLVDDIRAEHVGCEYGERCK